MKKKINNLITSRLHRSELAVPGSSLNFFEKAFNSDADYVFLDLEDSVAIGDKVPARKNVIAALNEIDWRAKGKTISVRINSSDTKFAENDIINIISYAGKKIDTILIPKVENKTDVSKIDKLISKIEKEKKLIKKIGLECLIETALGMINIEDIAKSSKRLEALHFGPGDYAASLRARTTDIGGLNSNYPGDQWHFALSKIVLTCRAFGLRPIDGAFDNFKDHKSYIASAKRAAAIGFEGKWAIHPSQIEHANKIFAPQKDEITKAKKIIKELKKIKKSRKGVAQVDGKMIDTASIRMAENIIKIDNLIKNKNK